MSSPPAACGHDQGGLPFNPEAGGLPAAASDSAARASASQARSRLKDMGETLKRLEHVFKDVYREVERRQEVLDTDPGYVSPALAGDGGFITPMFPQAVEFMKRSNLLPPRQKWMNHFKEQIESLEAILEDEIKDLKLPELKDARARLQWDVMQSTMSAVDENAKALEAMIKAPPYDNVEIAKKALNLKGDVEGMEKIRGQLLRTLDKEYSL